MMLTPTVSNQSFHQITLFTIPPPRGCLTLTRRAQTAAAGSNKPDNVALLQRHIGNLRVQCLYFAIAHEFELARRAGFAAIKPEWTEGKAVQLPGQARGARIG